MKRKNGWYIDENNNRWSDKSETEESARKKSESLTNCRDCYDCSYCSGCSDCSRCFDCSDCSRCFDCSDCSRCFDCSGCSDCSRCFDCSYCYNYKENPQRFTSSRIGSRKSQTTVYWLSKDDVQVICGCFKGDLDKFLQAVTDKHKGTDYEQQYLKLIGTVKYLISQEI